MIAQWKFGEPEEYGHYIVTTTQGTVCKAYYGHPNSERKTGWYVAFVGGYEQMDVVAYDNLPEPYGPKVFDVRDFIKGDEITEQCHSIFRGLGVGEELIDRLAYSEDNHIFDCELGRSVGDYREVDGGVPVVALHGYMAYPRKLIEQRLVNGRPQFWPTIVQRDKVGLEIRGVHAHPDLIHWLVHHVFTQEPEALARRAKSKPCLEYGSHQNEYWINIEFDGDEGIYDFVRYINENFKVYEND